jgi:hypothetical protein
MFGHDNQHHHDEENNLPEPSDTVVDDSTPAPVSDDAGTDAYMDDVPAAPSTVSPTTPPIDNDTAAPEEVPDIVPAPAVEDAPEAAPIVASEPTVTSPVDAVVPAPDTDKLLDIKQQALQQLTPLVGHLEQSPEEKFRTTMMMIQASDNHALVGAAYEAAQQIPDEKVRAQALLDIVNEINYFTHNSAEA